MSQHPSKDTPTPENNKKQQPKPNKKRTLFNERRVGVRRAVVDGPPTRATRQAREQECVGGRDARDGQRAHGSRLRELQQRRHGG